MARPQSHILSAFSLLQWLSAWHQCVLLLLLKKYQKKKTRQTLGKITVSWALTINGTQPEARGQGSLLKQFIKVTSQQLDQEQEWRRMENGLGRAERKIIQPRWISGSLQEVIPILYSRLMRLQLSEQIVLTPQELQCNFWLSVCELRPEIPGDAAAADLWTTFWVRGS